MAPRQDILYRLFPWLLSSVGVAFTLLIGPVALVPVGAGATFLVTSLTVGADTASNFDPGLYWMPPVLTSIGLLVAAVRRAIPSLRRIDLPSPSAATRDLLRQFFTLYLATQICVGFTIACLMVIVSKGVETMSATDLLIVSLFSIFVFIVATTFTSFFMRELIPWRKEHPAFSNAIAYTLSVLLGLIAATYAFAERTSLFEAQQIGAKLYQISIAFATFATTLVGAYVALFKNNRIGQGNGQAGNGGQGGQDSSAV